VANPPPDLQVEVRGSAYGAHAEPFDEKGVVVVPFADKQFRGFYTDQKDYRTPYPDVGFRVVLEPR
jgi:hypothetical protein